MKSVRKAGGRTFRSLVTREELFTALSRGFAMRRWVPTISGGVLVAEDGKRIGAVEIAILFLIGLFLVPFIFVGTLLWFAAVALYAGADRRRAFIVESGEGLYTVSCDDTLCWDTAMSVLRELITAGVVEIPGYAEVAEEKEITYEELLEAYAKKYGSLRAATMLEMDLQKLIEKGYSRREALQELAKAVRAGGEGTGPQP